MPATNSLRELLNEGKGTLSTRIGTPNTKLVETIGRSGVFDYIELLAEGTEFSNWELEDFCRAVELYPHLTAIIKVGNQPEHFDYLEKAIGAGFRGVVFADCMTAEDVERCVKAVTPARPDLGGTFRGGGRSFRNGGPNTKNGLAVMKDLVLDFMIETKTAMDNLDEIMEVEGVDFLHFGPSDYSLSIAKTTIAGVEPEEDTEVKDAFVHMINKALKKGIQPRVMTQSPDEAEEFMDLGVRHFNCGIDSVVMAAYYRSNGAKYMELLGRKAKVGTKVTS
jgi:2-keto-3-deoxy-L-rhamnonate aldolase RhmA